VQTHRITISSIVANSRFPPAFRCRMPKTVGLWLALDVVGLVIGMAGYAKFENMLLADADEHVNAAMAYDDGSED